MAGVSAQILSALLVTAIGLQVRQISTEGLSGQDYFDVVEKGVQRIASELANIYSSTCGPNNCQCSQDLCQPVPKDSKPSCFNETTLTSSLYNCSGYLESLDAGNICSSIIVTTSRSSVTYVRKNGVYDPPSNTQRSAICRTQQLDPIFIDIFHQTPIYTEFFAGTIDGSRRSFPGREVTGIGPRGESLADSCSMYDGRKRPYFSGATSHPNHLVILIDCGLGMADDASANKQYGSRLDASQLFALSLIETVYKDNYVNVFSFGAREEDTFTIPKLVQFTSNDPQSHPELDDLNQKIKNFSSADSDTSVSQFAKGLNLSLTAFNETSNATPANRLLNVIVFTDGSFIDGSFSTNALVRDVLDQVKRNNVEIFIYGINSEPYSSGLQNLSNEVSGTYRNFETTDLLDPLFSMRSYFGYLAASHQRLYDGALFWIPNYEDYYNVGGLLSGSVPVFNRNGSFVGVAAVDVILDELGTEDAVFRKDFENIVITKRNLQGVSTNATNENTVPVPQTIDDSCVNHSNKILCPTQEENSNEGWGSRTCCNRCGKHRKGDTKVRTVTIVGPVVGVAVIAVAVITCFVVRRKLKAKVRPRQGTVATSPIRPPEMSPTSRISWAEPL